jgi:hypothetical protein
MVTSHRMTSVPAPMKHWTPYLFPELNFRTKTFFSWLTLSSTLVFRILLLSVIPSQ